MNNRQSILIVDDTPQNLRVMGDILKNEEYEVRVATSGPQALTSTQASPPDLILLDVMMPEMDGFEVCARLKANPATCDIPVIFLTALTEEADEDKGLRLGAVDYIAKPFKTSLVVARVRNHLALRKARLEVERQRDQIATAYQKLRALEQLRDDLVHMIVHDLRSPLMVIGCYLDLMPEESKNIFEFRESICAMKQMIRELSEMVTSLLDVNRLESGKMPLHPVTCDLGQLTQNIIKRLTGLASGREVSVNLPQSPVIAFCDPNITERIIQNLLGNALKFTPEKSSIKIDLVAESQWTRVSISDTGPGIPPEYHEKVFQKFGQVEARKEGQKNSTGLGLAFCKLATEAQGGNIQLESELGKGATFHVRLPQTSGHDKIVNQALT